MHAVDVVRASGYAAAGGATPILNQAGVPQRERTLLSSGTLTICKTGRSPVFGTATFLTRAGVHQLLMLSTKPAAKEFREWLAGEVVVAKKMAKCGRLSHFRVFSPDTHSISSVHCALNLSLSRGRW